MKQILEQIEIKHKKLINLKPKLTKDLEKNLYEWFRIALTYTSNAIEGNTLSHLETAQVIEKNITVQGKSLTEHLEAINHAEAIDFTKSLSEIKTKNDITLDDILTIHKFILQRINNDNAGKLRTVPVRIMGSNIPVPNYVKVPELMAELVDWLHKDNKSIRSLLKPPVSFDNLPAVTESFGGHSRTSARGEPVESISSDSEKQFRKKPIIEIAADVHLKLAFIHPFVDGNGRTARLLMNLILLQKDYPLILIKVEDRLEYIKSIQKALMYVSSNMSAQEFVLGSDFLEIPEFLDYYNLIFKSIENSLDEYIKAIEG